MKINNLDHLAENMLLVTGHPPPNRRHVWPRATATTRRELYVAASEEHDSEKLSLLVKELLAALDGNEKDAKNQLTKASLLPLTEP